LLGWHRPGRPLLDAGRAPRHVRRDRARLDLGRRLSDDQPADVRSRPAPFGLAGGRARVRRVAPSLRPRSLPRRRRRQRRRPCATTDVNRAADVALAWAALLVASPLLAAGALAVKLQDGGPVLYRQRRVGKDGEEFELLKLR